MVNMAIMHLNLGLEVQHNCFMQITVVQQTKKLPDERQ